MTMLRHILIVTVFCHVTIAKFQFSNHEIGHNMMHETNIENLEKRNPDIATSVLKVFIENFKSFKVFRTVMNPKHSITENPKHSTIKNEIQFETLLNKMQKTFPELKDYHVVLVRKEED